MAQSHPGTILRHLRRLTGTWVDGEMTDGQLLERFVAGHDEAAFTTLVERHGPMVLGLCRRLLHFEHDAEDVFQATFLVLVRKARSLRQWGSLGNWLYTVTSHLAWKVQARNARRRAQETEVTDVPQTEPADPVWAELRPLLDAELSRLPIKYRAPVVLCYLEGKTNEQAARELGWPSGTVKCRLARARDLLRRRLAARGATTGSSLLGAPLAGKTSAAVPAALLQNTTQAAASFAAGTISTAGGLAPSAVLIAEGALRAMFVTKLQVAVVSAIVLGLAWVFGNALVSAAGSARSAAASPPAAAPTAREGDDKPAEDRPGEKQKRVTDIKKMLAQLVDVEEISEKTALKEVLDNLNDRYGLKLLIDQKAFDAIRVSNVEAEGVTLPKMQKVRLSTVLQRILSQIESDGHTGAYLVRPDHIEVTTTYQQLTEAGFPLEPDPAADTPSLSVPSKLRRITPIVQVDFDRRSLTDALRELADEASIDVVVDPRIAEKARTPITVTLQNVLFDTALTLLTELADVDWVWVDKVVFVTTKENARSRKEQMEKAKEAKLAAELKEARASAEQARQAPAPNPVPNPAPTSILVQADKQPLQNVLRQIADTHGVDMVIDIRLGNKAMVPVTTEFRAPPETAIRMIAEMYDLRVVSRDKVLFVTSPEAAKAGASLKD